MEGNDDKRPLRESMEEYARGITGGLLFSFPLLYTMEVWWAGFIASPRQLILLIFATFLLLLGYNRYAGMHPGASWRSVFVDSIEEMGIGIILSFIILLMLKRIDFATMALIEIVGKVVIEAMAVSIGVSIGTAQLGERVSEDEENGSEKSGQKQREVNRSSKMSMVVLAFCGSILVGGNVAPTEEILLLGIASEPFHILLMAIASILLTVIVVFFSDFKGALKYEKKSMLYEIVFDTCLCYLVALAASAFVLWFFGRFEGVSFWVAFAQCITLGLLSSLGASAGRLLIK